MARPSPAASVASPRFCVSPTPSSSGGGMFAARPGDGEGGLTTSGNGDGGPAGCCAPGDGGGGGGFFSAGGTGIAPGEATGSGAWPDLAGGIVGGGFGSGGGAVRSAGGGGGYVAVLAVAVALWVADPVVAAALSTSARTRSWSPISSPATVRSSSPRLPPRCPNRHRSRCSASGLLGLASLHDVAGQRNDRKVGDDAIWLADLMAHSLTRGLPPAYCPKCRNSDCKVSSGASSGT
jgi:hypothetical protein